MLDICSNFKDYRKNESDPLTLILLNKFNRINPLPISRGRGGRWKEMIVPCKLSNEKLAIINMGKERILHLNY